METYWNTNVVGQYRPYKKYTDDLKGKVIFPEIINHFFDSDDSSFEIVSFHDDIALRLRKTWCFMFIKYFKDSFGKGHRDRLMEGLKWYNDRPVYDKFLSPVALEHFWMQNYKQDLIWTIPSFTDLKTPMDRFLWALRYDMPGNFIWQTGASNPFSKWLRANQPTEQDLLPSCALINCWEMVFYTAIRAGLMDREKLKSAYEKNVDAAPVLDATFHNELIQCYTHGDKVTTIDSKPYALKVGDIVVVDTFLEEKDKDLKEDKNGKFFHVAAVIDVGQAGDDLVNIKVTSLWDAPPTTAIHPIKPILLALDDNEENRGEDKRGTKIVPWFRILRLGA